MVTNTTGAVIVRRVSQAKLKYLDFILHGGDMIRSEFPNRLNTTEQGKPFFEDVAVIQKRTEGYLMDFSDINGYSKGCQHPPAKDHQVHTFI